MIPVAQSLPLTPTRTLVLEDLQMFLQELREVRDEMRSLSSPWYTRERAAQYLGVKVAFVDKMAGRGKLRRHYLCAEPRFHRTDLDKLMTLKRDLENPIVTTPKNNNNRILFHAPVHTA